MWTRSEQQSRAGCHVDLRAQAQDVFCLPALILSVSLFFAHYKLAEWEGTCILTELAAVSSGCQFVFVVACSDSCHDATSDKFAK